MKIPVIVQHGERKVAASLLVIVGRERTELMPTQQHLVLVDEQESTLAELSVLRWTSPPIADGNRAVPAIVHAPRDRALTLHVNGAAPVEIPAGDQARFEISDEPIVIEITVGAAPAGAAGPARDSARRTAVRPAAKRKAGRGPGRSQVKPRQNRGRKAGR